MLDPMRLSDDDVVRHVRVVKIFDSKAKPVLLEMVGLNTRNLVICKLGDDIRNDWYIQTMFYIFNNFWKNDGSLSTVPFIYRYKCTPIINEKMPKLGCIECVSNVTSAFDFDWSSVRTSMTSDQRKSFFASLAGSFVASYVLGIRDRHQDNMLIKDGYIFFNIDFGHLWNQGPLVDAPRIAIPVRLKSNLFLEEWDLLVELCVNAFLILHKNAAHIVSICSTLFKTIHEKEKVESIEDFLYGNNSLMINGTEEQARAKFKRVIIKCASTYNMKRKFKNWAHTLGKDTAPKIQESENL